MTPQTVRAVLAYVMTASLLACLFLVAFRELTQFQAAMVGTVLGAIVGNSKVPLSYFFDGVAIAEQNVTTTTPPMPAPKPPPMPDEQTEQP